MSYVKKIAAGAGIVGALAITVLGPATGVANADTASPYLGGFASDNPGYGPGYGYNGACAWVPPFITQWIPPVVCGG
jgi:hypothetical protein